MNNFQNNSVLFNKNNIAESLEEIWDDSELIKMYEKATAKAYEKVQNSVNLSGENSSTQPQWKVGDNCFAPYSADGRWYPAIIESISDDRKTCKINFTGYEMEDTVLLAQIVTDQEELEWINDETEQQTPAEEQPQAADIKPSSTTNGMNNAASPFPIPDHCPPPPPALFGKVVVAGSEKEALTNTLMSWYMAGYHTGYYQGMLQKKSEGTKQNQG